MTNFFTFIKIKIERRAGLGRKGKKSHMREKREMMMMDETEKRDDGY